MFIILARVNELLLGVEVESLRREADVRLDADSSGEGLVEDGGEASDELDRAEGDSEGVSLSCDDGDRERFGRLRCDEVLDAEEGSEVLLSFDGVVEASVSNEFVGFLGCIGEGAAVGLTAEGNGAED